MSKIIFIKILFIMQLISNFLYAENLCLSYYKSKLFTYSSLSKEELLKFNKKIKISEKNIMNFAGISGDDNPIHTDFEMAKSLLFGRQVAHGMLTFSHMSHLVKMILKSQYDVSPINVAFKNPVFINDNISFEFQLSEDKESNKINVISFKNESSFDENRKEAITKIPIAIAEFEVISKSTSVQDKSEAIDQSFVQKPKSEKDIEQSGIAYSEKIVISDEMIKNYMNLIKLNSDNKVIVPREFIGGLFSRVLNKGLTAGGLYLKQNFKFESDFKIGSQYNFLIENYTVGRGGLAKISILVKNDSDEIVASGLALVQFPRSK